jgi:hypothetical protein
MEAGPGLACQWQLDRVGTAIEELTANPEGGRSGTLGVGAWPASGRIRSPAIVPADIATPSARSAPAVGHRSTGTVAPYPNLPSQPAGRRLAELAWAALANEPARPPWGTPLPGARPWTGQNGSKPHAAACGAADEPIPAGAEASGLAPGPVSSSDPGRCSVLRATGCARQCGRRYPRSLVLARRVRRE